MNAELIEKFNQLENKLDYFHRNPFNHHYSFSVSDRVYPGVSEGLAILTASSENAARGARLKWIDHARAVKALTAELFLKDPSVAYVNAFHWRNFSGSEVRLIADESNIVIARGVLVPSHSEWLVLF